MPEIEKIRPSLAVILTALPLEYQAVRAHLTHLQEEVHPQGTIYERGSFSSQGRSWEVVIGEIGMGNPGAAMEAERAIHFFKPQIMFFVGIAGGLKDVSIGDVVAATKVYGYESGKASTDFLPRPSMARSTYRMEQRARAEARKTDWLQLMKGPFPVHTPHVFVEPIAAGEKVIASTQSELARFLKTQYGDAVAIEMESYGFLYALHANPYIEALVVRGISDLLDGKQEADAANLQQVAAQHASAFAFQVLATVDLTSIKPAPQKRFPAPFPETWNVPYRYNHFLIGRQYILKYLNDALFTLNEAGDVTLPRALNGSAGMGKTQTATAYAYTYRGDYQTVLWAKADTRSTLLADYREIASLLKLPEQQMHDDTQLLTTLMNWFRYNSEWLLILDNADDVALIEPFMPSAARGHILLTTRMQAVTRLAAAIELEKLAPEDGAVFMLRRGGILRPGEQLGDIASEKLAGAEAISQLVDGLPLALEQAGAYIEETQCGIFRYLKLYQERSNELRQLHGELTLDYPKSVATTWDVSIKNLQATHPVAVELLQFCAFLYPDAIPEEIITKGARYLGPPLQSIASDPLKLDATIKELGKYSLIKRDTDRNRDIPVLTLHRLVQDVQKDMMEPDTQQLWAERAVRALCELFLHTTPHDRERYQALLPHAQVCANLIKRWNMGFAEAQLLLKRLEEKK